MQQFAAPQSPEGHPGMPRGNGAEREKGSGPSSSGRLGGRLQGATRRVEQRKTVEHTHHIQPIHTHIEKGESDGVKGASKSPSTKHSLEKPTVAKAPDRSATKPDAAIAEAAECTLLAALRSANCELERKVLAIHHPNSLSIYHHSYSLFTTTICALTITIHTHCIMLTSPYPHSLLHLLQRYLH